MSKSSQAFRTIREVADWLGVAAHVLRFWESKFPQIKPVKRAGGRRYYRPADMELVGGIKVLLHDRGMTIKGVQTMIRDEGQGAVAALSPSIDALIGGDVIEADSIEGWTRDAETDAATSEPQQHADPEPLEPPQTITPEPEPASPEPPASAGTAPVEVAPETSEQKPKVDTFEQVSATDAPEDGPVDAPEDAPEMAADRARQAPTPSAEKHAATVDDLPPDLTVSPGPPPPEAAPRPSFVALRHLQHLARTRNVAKPVPPESIAALRALCDRMQRDPGENAP